MQQRCPWADKPLFHAYHDEEWGRPVHEDKKHFEFLVLEAAQAGLSWATILKRREGYRQAFAQFNPERVADFSDKHVEELLQNTAVIRNKSKIRAAIHNARRFLAVQKEFGSFDEYIWRFVNHRPIVNSWLENDEVPAVTPESKKLSQDLKRRGFQFVGPTIMYAHMQAVGMVNDHLLSCFVRQEML